MTSLGQLEEILFPKDVHQQVVEHARRKLRRSYLPDEEQARKAYGLLAGRRVRTRMVVTHAFPLRRNLRHEPRFKPYVDEIMDDVAVPSETPFEQRGWVSDAAEVRAAEEECERAGSRLFGGYHMHRVPWPHDPLRNTCTTLDTRLAEGSGLWTVIVSMVDPERPSMRAFFEGHNHHEAPVRVGDGK